MADDSPVIPPEPAAPPAAPAEPAAQPEKTPLDQAPLSEFVKRRAQGDTVTEPPAEKLADDAEIDADGEPVDKGTPKPGAKSVPKNRFDQVYRQRSDAIRERDAEKARAAQLESELQLLRQRPAVDVPAQPAKPDTGPVLDEFLAAGKTYEHWMDARIEWQAQKIADARIVASRQQQQFEQGEAERQRQVSGLGERTEAAKAKYPDYETVVIQNEKVRLSPVMADIATRSPHGPDIMYWLGTHEAEAAEIGELTKNYGPASYPLVEQHLILLSGQSKPLSTGAKKAVPISQAPAPISPVGGGSSTTTVPLDQMPLGDFVKRRNAIDQKKRTG